MGKSHDLATLKDDGGTFKSSLVIDTGTNGTPNIDFKHANSSADQFRLQAGTPAVTNGGFSIYDIDASQTRLNIDASGRVTMPYQPCFHARPSTVNGANWSNGVYVTTYGSVPINDGNHFNGTTGIFTAPVAGRYVFHASLRFDGFNGSYLYYDIRINDSGRQARSLTSLNFTYHTYALSCVANMQANDTARIWVNSVGDTSVDLDGDCDFYGYMVG